MPVSLAEARLLQRLRRGEPAAFQELWEGWKNPIWSICKAMSTDPSEARAHLLAIYQDYPAAARGWTHDHPLCCQVGALVHATIAADLELPALEEVPPQLPEHIEEPAPAEVLARIARVPPLHRLIYLTDLFFHCPAGETSSILGISETALRHARSQVAWALVASQGGRS